MISEILPTEQLPKLTTTSSPELERQTWDLRVPVVNQAQIMVALRAAGLPLANTTETVEDESNQSQLVCVAEVREHIIHALVATPSGLVYRFEPQIFESTFWAFAARNYYWVTSSMGDREHVSRLTGVPMKNIKGRTLSRVKSELSNVALNKLLKELGAATAEQSALF